MNSLSWFLYLSDVVGNVGNFAGIVVVLVPIVAVFGLVFAPIIPMMLEDAPDAVVDAVKRVAWPLGKTIVVVWVCSAVLSLVAPSKNTLYAIAASEMGERVLKTEVATDAQKALQQWIKRQIEPEKKS